MGDPSAVAALGMALGGWTWVLAGLVLLGLEIVAPGTFMLWFGIAAIVTGAVAIGFDLAGSQALGWQAEVILFLALSVVAVGAGRTLFRGRPEAAANDSALNRRASRYIGREAVLSEAISGGVGRVRLDDTIWLVAGPELPAGTRVKVTGTDGPRLKVERAG
jgi:membrane protein implicated in regulation of membrane protease activity